MVSHLLLREASSNTSLAGTDCCSGSQADFSCRTLAEFSGLQHFVLLFGQLAGQTGQKKEHIMFWFRLAQAITTIRRLAEVSGAVRGREGLMGTFPDAVADVKDWCRAP